MNSFIKLYSFYKSPFIANLVIICLILIININVYSQSDIKSTIKGDSFIKNTDTISLKSSSEDIKSKIIYEAEDSMIYDIKTKKLYLFNQSKIDYTDMHIDAYFIEYDWTSGVMSANQNKINEDSVIGRPYMKQDGKGLL